ncbi:MAG TPA: hypothetical protein VGR71_05665 [Nitrospira sp.]|nr:hypothetical protein [Nitrospira sp.]
MKVEHLGQIVDMDPARASLDHKIIELLRKRGPLKQNTVYVTTCRHPQFLEAVESLVQRNLIVRETTSRRNSFVLRLIYSGPNKGRV